MMDTPVTRRRACCKVRLPPSVLELAVADEACERQITGLIWPAGTDVVMLPQLVRIHRLKQVTPAVLALLVRPESEIDGQRTPFVRRA